MSRLTRIRQTSILVLPALLILTLPFLAGCGGGTGGAEGSADDSDLMVTYFSHSKRTDVPRNEVLELRFTAPVHPDSISHRTFRVLYGPTLQTPHLGAAVVDGNVIQFIPTRSQEGYERDGLSAAADIPFGFVGSTEFQLYLPAHPTLVTLTNLAGNPIVAEYVDSFTTSDEYVQELDQPRYLGPDGQGDGLRFEPEPIYDPDYQHPGLQQPGATVVAYDAWFYLQFDEVILPSTMDPGVTVKVENMDVSDAQGFPFTVPGTLTPLKDGTSYVFRPTFGFGGGPFRIRVTLSQAITDLAGNPLLNAPLSIYFYTEYKEGVTTPGSLVERFDNDDNVDIANTTADWSIGTPGWLTSGPITTRVVVVDHKSDGINSRETLTNYPLVRVDADPGCNNVPWPNGCRMLQSYTITELGSTPGTITELGWGPNSNATFVSYHSNVQITYGHVADPNNDGNAKAEVVGTFKSNFDGGMPSPHYSGSYSIPQRLNINPPGLDNGFWPYPKNTRPFDYDGTRGVVVDFNMDPGTDCQTIRGWNWGVPGAANAPGIRNLIATAKDAEVDNFSVPSGGQMYVIDARFTIRRGTTIGQSKFYDTNVTGPFYSAPIVSPPEQPNSASYLLEFQGATNRWNFNTYSAWTEDIEDLNDPNNGGPRYIRFRFTLYSDLDTDTLAQIDQITFPFEF